MHDRFIRALPDILPENLDSEVGDPEVVAEIRQLHAALVLKDNANQRRKKELFEKYGIMLQGKNDVGYRLNLLIEMFIGHLAPERLRYELKWLEAMGMGLEEAYSGYLEQKRQEKEGKSLFIPGKGEHAVPAPPKEEPNG